MTVTSDVVAAHADAVWRTAFRLLNNREDALDCYQQTFLDAMRLDPNCNDWGFEFFSSYGSIGLYHCFHWKQRSRLRIHESRPRSTEGVWQKPK
jgi:DNA-directed RNA polymerase specialized sigma24 family protein